MPINPVDLRPVISSIKESSDTTTPSCSPSLIRAIGIQLLSSRVPIRTGDTMIQSRLIDMKNVNRLISYERLVLLSASKKTSHQTFGTDSPAGFPWSKKKKNCFFLRYIKEIFELVLLSMHPKNIIVLSFKTGIIIQKKRIKKKEREKSLFSSFFRLFMVGLFFPRAV
jgi:hypothetical protein